MTNEKLIKTFTQILKKLVVVYPTGSVTQLRDLKEIKKHMDDLDKVFEDGGYEDLYVDGDRK